MAGTSLFLLQRTIESFLNHLPYSKLLPNPETEYVKREVWSLQLFLGKEIITNTPESNRLNALQGQIMEAIQKFKDVFESHVNKYCVPNTSRSVRVSESPVNRPRFPNISRSLLETHVKIHSISYISQSVFESSVNISGNIRDNRLIFSQDLEKFKQEIKFFVETIKQIKDEYRLSAEDLEPSNKVLLFSDSVSMEKDFGEKMDMVGLHDELEKLKDRLVGEPTGRLEIVSVIGMAGIGKTTLVKQVYNHKLISDHYGFRAFVGVGYENHPISFLLNILVHLYPNVDIMQITNEEELILDIRRGLKDRRYLIVFDDVWNIDVWNENKRAFPDEHNGSRIIWTTRLLDVARYLTTYDDVHQIRFLNEEESWNLFCKNVFVEEESCPPALKKVGKKIVQYCEGLPLGIIGVADLSKADKTQEYWEKIAENDNLLATAADDGTPISKALYLSYKHLSKRLKECFLYLGVFPLNHVIPISKIVKLWVAEGLIEPHSYKSFAETAEEYLEDLVSRTIVLIRHQSSSGGVKTCNTHYFFWHLCVREAEKNKFFHIVKHGDAFSENIHSQRRLCIHRNVLLNIKDVYESIESVKDVRSFLCTGPNHQYPVPICSGLTSLRVLDALSVRFYKFPIEIVELVELRYLAFTYNGKIPSSISRLQKLQYLIVHQYHLNINRSAPSYMPMEIWNMQELRHLQVMGSDMPDPAAGAFLPNLLTLLDVSALSCTKEVLEKIPNLEKLGIRIVLKQGVSEALRDFDHLALLPELKSFKYIVLNPNLRFQSHSIFTVPYMLRKLTLSGCVFAWKDMSLIGALQYLKVLKLRCYAFQGAEWELGEKEFSELEYLLLEDTDLVHWRVKDNCFHKLHRLIIRHCYKLEEIPSKLRGIVIEVVDCSPSVLASAKKLQLHQVQVYSSWIDEKLKPCLAPQLLRQTQY